MQNEAKSILVADADQAMGKAIGEWLKAWGWDVTVVQDGCQALGLLMRERFAAVLLDIHLPIVGGIDATQALRAGEQGGERMPIVGLQLRQDGIATGRLIEAGMDAVLTKPFSPAELHQAIERLAKLEPATADARPERAWLTTVDAEGCMDPNKVAEFVTGDAELFGEMVELLESELPRRCEQICATIQQGDGKALERSAHSLKGALSYFCRKEVLDLLQTLERYGREMDFASADELMSRLKVSLPRLQAELGQHTAEVRESVPVARISSVVAVA